MIVNNKHLQIRMNKCSMKNRNNKFQSKMTPKIMNKNSFKNNQNNFKNPWKAFNNRNKGMIKIKMRDNNNSINKMKKMKKMKKMIWMKNR